MSTSKKPDFDWAAYARNLDIRTQAYIDGKFVDAVSGETFEVVSPIDGRVLCGVASCDSVDVDLAVRSGRRAFESGSWSRMAPRRRKKILLTLAEQMLAHRQELAALETLDVGKPIKFSNALDIPASANAISWYAEAIDKIYGEIAPLDGDSLGLITREPLGVVAVVVPWNFPLLMTCWKIGAALAAGNSVVLKPAEQSPLSALLLAEIASKAGLPDGVLNVVPGLGRTAGQAIGLHPDIDNVGFTGSTEVGKLFLRYAAESNMKSVYLECGGKSPQIVTENVRDLDAVAKAVVQGAFFNQGQVCTAGSRLLVSHKVKDALLEKIVGLAGAMMPADPLNAGTSLGALVDKTQLDRVQKYVAEASKAGAVNVGHGDVVLEETGGYYMRPAIFTDVRPEMAVAREEIFGPVLACIAFDDVEDAIRMANDSMYGLVAGIWNDDLGGALKIAARIRTGTVWVNTYDQADMATPFGGVRQSGFGRDRSLHALEKYTYLKTTWAKL